MWLRLILIGLSVWLVVYIISYTAGLRQPAAPPPPKSAQGPVSPPRPHLPQGQAVPPAAAPAAPSEAAKNVPPSDAAKKMEALRKAIEGLPKGNIVLDAPSKMAVDDEREVKATVGINVPISELRKQSAPSNQQVEGSLYLSPQMTATLSGPGFKIEQITPEKQSIAEGFPTIWSWNVTAKREGEERLEATLYVLVGDGNETSSHTCGKLRSNDKRERSATDLG